MADIYVRGLAPSGAPVVHRMGVLDGVTDCGLIAKAGGCSYDPPNRWEEACRICDPLRAVFAPEPCELG